MSHKLQNTRYLHCLNNFNICYSYVLNVSTLLLYKPIVFFAVCGGAPPCWRVQVLTTLGSDIRQQSLTKNTFTVIQAVYFCFRFNENNANFCPYVRRQWKPSHYASNKGRKLKYQKGVTFLAHTVLNLHLTITTKTAYHVCVSISRAAFINLV